MAQLIKGRSIAVNEWRLAGDVPAAAGEHMILPLADYLKAVAAGEPVAQRAPLLAPADHDLAPLLPWLPKAPLIAIHFGSSGEGRGYTQARLLRERYGYKGELRAVGKIMVDQIFFLARCGFDAFDLFEGEDVATAIAQLDRFTVAYQSAVPGLTHTRRRYGS